MDNLTSCLTSLSLASLSFIALPACGSSSSGARTADAGSQTDRDASHDAPTEAAEAGPAPVKEPPWSGMTVEPACTQNGCIHAFTKGAAYDQALLQGAADPTFKVNNGVTEYAITYVSDGAEITGSVFFPDSTPPPGGFDVVVMSQFTSGLAPVCAPSAGFLALGVASVPALNGYVTLVPDWTSYGKAPFGGYSIGPLAGKAALDGVRAAFHTSQASGIPVARRAIVAGQSEGAYGTMAAATQYPTYANQLEVKGFAAAEPPSNLETSFQQAVQADMTSIVYDAMRLYSWQGTLGLSGGQLFAPPYDVNVPKWLSTECIFDGANGSNGKLYAEFPMNASSVLSPSFLGYARTGNWPADWQKAYDASKTVPSYLALPVLIFEGTADTTVLPAGVDTYVAQLEAAGVSVDYLKIPGGTHGTTALTSFTVAQLANGQAIAWFASTLAK